MKFLYKFICFNLNLKFKKLKNVITMLVTPKGLMKDYQYNYMKELANTKKSHLGLVSNSSCSKDPKRFLFSLSRYKFVLKMLSNSKNVLEVVFGFRWNAKFVCVCNC